MIETIGKWWREVKGLANLAGLWSGILFSLGVVARPDLGNDLSVTRILAIPLLLPVAGMTAGGVARLLAGRGIGKCWVWLLCISTLVGYFLLGAHAQIWRNSYVYWVFAGCVGFFGFLAGLAQPPKMPPTRDSSVVSHVLDRAFKRPGSAYADPADDRPIRHFSMRVLVWFSAFLLLSGVLGLLLSRFPESDYALPLLLAFLLSVGMSALLLVYLARNTRIPGIDDPLDEEDRDRE